MVREVVDGSVLLLFWFPNLTRNGPPTQVADNTQTTNDNIRATAIAVVIMDGEINSEKEKK